LPLHTFSKLYGIKNQTELAVIDFVWLRSELKKYCWKSTGGTRPSVQYAKM